MKVEIKGILSGEVDLIIGRRREDEGGLDLPNCTLRVSRSEQLLGR